MKKLLAYFCVIVGLAALVIAHVTPIANRIWKWNKTHALNNAWWGKHNSGGGDLVALSYLDDIPQFNEPKQYHFARTADSAKNIDLYLFGDSFTEDLPDSIFAHSHAYHYGNYVKGLTYQLDPTKKNILILEVSERFMFQRYSDNDIFERLKPVAGNPVPDTSRAGTSAAAAAAPVSSAPEHKNYSAIVNKNLEYVMFDYNFLNWIRRYKADMNYTLFNRASGDVAISGNGKYLFFKPTVDPEGMYSIYGEVGENALANLVRQFNEIYKHYRAAGFAEVYLSIIPNAATILQPEGYNQLIPKVQQAPGLKVPLIDVYSVYKQNNDPALLFRQGDTHWNNNGMQVWLSLVNDQLNKQSTGVQ